MPMLVWLDIETTGLNPEMDDILEIAASVADLETPFKVTPVYHAVLWSPEMHRTSLSKVVIKMHTENGLFAECMETTVRIADAEEALLDAIPMVADYSERAVLAGASVHFDAGFLKQHMPELSRRFSHRYYDVSAVKLFCRSLGMEKIESAGAHRAQADVAESIEHAKQCASWLRTQALRGCWVG